MKNTNFYSTAAGNEARSVAPSSPRHIHILALPSLCSSFFLQLSQVNSPGGTGKRHRLRHRMSQEAVTKRKPFVVGKIMPKRPKVGHIRLVIDILFFHPFHDAQLALTNGRMVDGFLAHKNAFAATFLGKVAVFLSSFLPSWPDHSSLPTN